MSYNIVLIILFLLAASIAKRKKSDDSNKEKEKQKEDKRKEKDVAEVVLQDGDDKDVPRRRLYTLRGIIRRVLLEGTSRKITPALFDGEYLSDKEERVCLSIA